MASREPKVPVDDRIRALALLYEDAHQRLERLVREALERGAEGTAGYYASQLQQVKKVLSGLQDAAVPAAAQTAAIAYSSGLQAAEATITGRPAVAFTGVHQQAVDVLADNLVSKLNEAAVTVGRRTEDAFRRAALRQAAVGIAAGQARREVQASLMARIIEDGVTDALTGFVDRAGKRWPLDVYSKMVARTTVREAVTQGTLNRVRERGGDRVTISSHANPCDVCAEFDGRTFLLDELTDVPPFHPNCGHVLTPAAANLDDFEKALREAA